MATDVELVFCDHVARRSPLFNCDTEQRMWGAIQGLINEIKTCEAAGATTFVVAMTFVCMDTMAYL